MGMFDYINCKYPLPLTEELKALNVVWAEKEFQTKDLDNYLGNYIIAENGELLEHIQEREYVPYTKEEVKQKQIKAWDLWKEVLVKNEYDKKINHHGVITFYTDAELNDSETLWIDFKAFFIYGKLDKIELVETKKTKSSSFNLEEWKEKQKKEDALLWNRIRRALAFVGWKWLWRKAAGICYKLSNLFSTIQHFIIRYIA
jgi:hypothetical protein